MPLKCEQIFKELPLFRAWPKESKGYTGDRVVPKVCGLWLATEARYSEILPFGPSDSGSGNGVT